MEEQMKVVVNMLKERVKQNLQVIKKNEEVIRNILSQPISNERSKLLKENFSINRKLLEENNDSLSIEIQIINYLGKFREVLKHQSNNTQAINGTINKNDDFESEVFQNENKPEQLENIEVVDLLNLTLSGEIQFNSKHPKFNDEEFFEALLDGYKQTENYEMCSSLLKTKGKK